MLDLSQKTVLVTGATGLIGSHIVDALMDMGDVDVIALSRDGEKLRRGFAEYLERTNFHYIAQDICDPIRLPEGTGVDVIFHAASLVGGKGTASRPLEAIDPNIFGTRNCLDLLLRQKEAAGISGRLVLFSSVTVYGNTSREDITVTEDDTETTEKLDAKSAPYSQSKRMAEVMALAYHRQFGIDVVIVRPSTVYGPSRFIPHTLFYDFIESALSGQDILINNPAAPRRDNIYVDDAVSGILCVCRNGISGQAYNVSSSGEKGNYAAVDEIAQMVADAIHDLMPRSAAAKVVYGKPTTGARSAGIKLDNGKLKSLGWKLAVDMEDGIMRAAANRVRGNSRHGNGKNGGI